MGVLLLFCEDGGNVAAISERELEGNGKKKKVKKYKNESQARY